MRRALVLARNAVAIRRCKPSSEASAVYHFKAAGFSTAAVTVRRSSLCLIIGGSRSYSTEAESDDEEVHDDESDRTFRPAELPGDHIDDLDIFQLEPNAEVTHLEPVNQLWASISGALPETKCNVVDFIKLWQLRGNKISRKDITVLITRLRRRGRYIQALQISDWMAEEKPCNTGIRDKLTRLYLSSRCGRFREAEEMLADLGVSFHNEMTYTFLLSGYTAKVQVKRAELLWRRMKEKGCVKTPHGYNNMLIMYKRKKLHGDLRRLYVEMLLSRIAPDATTYLILLAAREDVGGFDGIERKAGRSLEALEILNLPGCTMEIIMRAYGYLANLEGVERMWQRICTTSSSFHSITFLCAIEAFGMAGGIRKAEELFVTMKTENKEVDLQRHYAILDVYSRAGMAEKAEAVLQKLISEGHDPSGIAFNSVIKTFLKQKQLDRAVALFDLAMGRFKATQTVSLKSSIVAIMEAYAESGDVGAAEKIVAKCKDRNYFNESRLYNALLKVYLNAQLPAMGVEDRFRRQAVKEVDAETRELLLKLGKIQTGDREKAWV